MYVWAIIPIKPLNRAKSRLAGVLSPDMRQLLAEAMFRRVLHVVTRVPEVVGTLVISRDNKALAIAREYGARTIQEGGSPELNAALTRASEVLSSWGCESTLVLPADLPLLTEEDVAALIDLGRDVPSVVIATDMNRNGTNALLMRPSGLLPYSYSDGSFERHKALARAAGVEPKVYESERLALDIDVLDDLREYANMAQRMGFDPLPYTVVEGVGED